MTTSRTATRRLLVDRAAKWFVAAGGMAIIASILGILVFIVLEVLPLTRPARVEIARTLEIPGEARGLVVDEYRELAAALGASGTLRILDLADGRVVEEHDLLGRLAAPASPADAGDETGDAATDAPVAPELLGVAVPPGGRALVAAISDGRLVAQPVAWSVTYSDSGERVVAPDLPEPVVLELDAERRPLGVFAAQVAGAASAAAAAQLADGRISFVRLERTENAFSGEVELSEERYVLATAPELTSLLLDSDARNLFAGTADGELLWWNLADGEASVPQTASAGGAAITALTFLIGDRTLVVGQESGAISIWFPVRQEDESFRLTRIRDFPARPAAIALLAPSERNRTFFAQDRDGGLGLYFSTSERVLWQGRSPVADATSLAISPKGDGGFVAGEHGLGLIDVANPHPEVSWKALFGKVWFEGYEKEEYVWQSTGGTDDFESKLSLTPLIVGTLKGTLYSLLLAIPLGVLGAMFASQFLHPKLLTYVKPTVEIMAALPSVVLGFLAGLWLAPVLERTFPGLLLMFVVLPVAVWLTGVAWSRLPLAVRNRFPGGAEVFLYLGVVALALWGCVAASPMVERLVFGGNFQAWLLEATGLRYDQRNAVVVGLAMGFAVIPIIFAIAEDAFSNVPRNLIAGSLALGANRWQTVTRVVLPTASPGIFSAIMIGFGRAVGETMIVLMATGNTPIMEMNPFNGFRTLSANIAVEIPEAPHGGTLYRTLFLAALILFLLTFLVNTFAELVRQRLRRRYAQL
ncbi:MAG: hypothetical protein AMXMBFR36_36390 [Acidobacteriota bacterium]